MSRRRFFCTNIAEPGQQVFLAEPEANHALRILRLRLGDEVELLDGDGCAALATVVEACDNRRELRLGLQINARHRQAPPPWQPRLLVAPPRGKLMSQIIRQAIELGVMRITPIVCAFSVACPQSSEPWQHDLIAALKQSGSRFLPKIDPPCTFAQALATAGSQGVLGSPERGGGGAAAFADWQPGAVDIWIGPEGGFSAEEIQALRQGNVVPVRVGPNILRVETAAVALLAWLWAQVDNNNDTDGDPNS